MRTLLLGKRESLIDQLFPTFYLLAELIDYAGLFPPAQLDMEPAVAEFARQRGSGDAWILSRFVVPLGRLEELENAARDHFNAKPWPLSVLAAGQTEDQGLEPRSGFTRQLFSRQSPHPAG